MNEIAVFTGSLTIYWSSIVICLGIAAGLCLSLALYPMDHRHNTAVWVFFPIATVLSILLSRLIHWYSHIEQYGSLMAAMTDYSNGGYCIQGIILGVLFAALLVRLVRLTPTAGELLDAVAPGLALCLALVRLSSLADRHQRLPLPAAALRDLVDRRRGECRIPRRDLLPGVYRAAHRHGDHLRLLFPAPFGTALGGLPE